MRPPADLGIITARTLPPLVRDQLEEKDGRIGYIISIRPAPQLDEWNGRDLIRFAPRVPRIALPDGEAVTTSGGSIVFAVIMDSTENDGPPVTGLAAVGL